MNEKLFKTAFFIYVNILLYKDFANIVQKSGNGV